MVAIIFVASLYGAYHQKLLISRVSIEGNKTVSDFEIRQVVKGELSGKYFRLYPKSNALLFPRDQVIQAIAKAFPRLSSIKLEQPDLRSLVLTVEERHGEFLWCLPDIAAGLLGDECYFTDDAGFVFSPAPKFSSPLYFEFVSPGNAEPLGKRALPPAEWQKLVGAEKRIGAILADSPLSGQKTFRAVPAELHDWYFKIINPEGLLNNQTWEIRLDLDQDLEVAMKTLSSLLVDPDFIKDFESHKSGLEYLDLRFAPKVFYRYNDK